MIDLNTFSKISKECGRFGQIYYCQRLKKLPKVKYVAQSGHTDGGNRRRLRRSLSMSRSGSTFCLPDDQKRLEMDF